MRSCLIAFVLSGLAAVAGAEEPSAVAEEIEVLGRRLPRSIEATGASLSVVSGADLAARQTSAAGDAAASVPGAYLASGAPGSPSSLFLRGAGSNQTAVLVDGVRVNDPTLGGQFNFFDLGLENVERVEILRGAASSLYGSDAIGGVVNLVTRRGRGPLAGRALVEAGSFGHYRAGVAAGGEIGAFDFSYEGGYDRWRNDLHHHEYESAAFAGNLGYAVAENLRLRLRGRTWSSRAEEPWDYPFGAEIPEDGNLDRTRDSWLFGLCVEFDPVENLTLSADLSFFRVSSLLENGPDAPGDPIELRSRSIAGVGTLLLAGRTALPEIAEWADLSLLFGGEAEDEESENRVVTGYGPSPPIDRTVRDRALFAVLEAVLGDAVTLSGGIRHDHDSFSGGVTNLSASALWRIEATGTRLRSNYGEGYRAPKPIEFDDPWVGNPDLAPERSASFDAGVEQEFLGGDLVLGVTWFSLRTRDLIAWDPESMILENYARARVRGAEFEVVGRPAEGLLLRAWFTRQHPKDLSGGGRLPGRPRWYGGGEARYTSGDLTLSLGVEAAGDHPGTGKIDPDGDVRRHPGKRFLVALRASYAATEWLSLHARVENLLDQDWYATEVSPPGNGIGFVLGVEGVF